MVERAGTPKIGVYSIMKNESANIIEWVEAGRDADVLVLADTGSTDDTLRIAREQAELRRDMVVAEVGVVPFRFEVGFNAALALVPRDVDVCLCLHLDDRVHEGWRPLIEDAWRAGGNRFTFLYHWSPELDFRLDRFHSRSSYQWKLPAHESLVGPGPRMDTGVEVTQLRDLTKDRSQDPGLIYLSAEENPNDPRAVYYAAREHHYHGEYVPSRNMFDRYLAMPDAFFDQERAEACRFQSRMVWPQHKERWLLRAVSEAPRRRECWADLASYYADNDMAQAAAGAASRVLSITTPDMSNSFHLEHWAWDDERFAKMLNSMG